MSTINVIVQQPYPVAQVVSTSLPKPKCITLIVFGVIELIFSSFLCGWTLWVLSLKHDLSLPYWNLVTGFTFLIVSVLTFPGGINLIRHRRKIVACLVLCIVGFALATFSTIWNVLFMIDSSNCFDVCDNAWFVDGTITTVNPILCPDWCSHREAMFVPLMVFPGICAAVGLIISFVCCFALTSCCRKKSTPGYVLNGASGRVFSEERANLPSYEYQPARDAPQYIVQNPDFGRNLYV